MRLDIRRGFLFQSTLKLLLYAVSESNLAEISYLSLRCLVLTGSHRHRLLEIEMRSGQRKGLLEDPFQTRTELLLSLRQNS